MANGRLFHFLSIFWLGLAVICLLGHYLADATALGCKANSTVLCATEDNNTDSRTPGENVPNMTALHAGFNLPPINAVAVGPALTLDTVVLLLMPIAVKPAPLSLPPQ